MKYSTLIIILELVNALLEYLDLIFYYANYTLKLYQNAGIMLNSFTPSLFMELFGHNSRTPSATQKHNTQFWNLIASCLQHIFTLLNILLYISCMTTFLCIHSGDQLKTSVKSLDLDCEEFKCTKKKNSIIFW